MILTAIVGGCIGIVSFGLGFFCGYRWSRPKKHTSILPINLNLDGRELARQIYPYVRNRSPKPRG